MSTISVLRLGASESGVIEHFSSESEANSIEALLKSSTRLYENGI
jgi:hypothetical protein